MAIRRLLALTALSATAAAPAALAHDNHLHEGRALTIANEALADRLPSSFARQSRRLGPADCGRRGGSGTAFLCRASFDYGDRHYWGRVDVFRDGAPGAYSYTLNLTRLDRSCSARYGAADRRCRTKFIRTASAGE